MFKAELHFPDDSSNSPSTIYIKTRNMYHPNVASHDGHFCLNMFCSDKWTPNNTIVSTPMTVQVVLIPPNPASPLNDEEAHVYRTNQAEYERCVQLVAQ
jgi:ubiquitin-protein ligase